MFGSNLSTLLRLGVVGALGLSSFGVQAQVPPVVPGFPHQMACTPGELYFRQVGLDRVGNITYHNGRIYTNNVTGTDRREWVFTNPSDPASLTLVTEGDQNINFRTQHGGHSLVKVGDYAGDFLRRVSPGVNANGDELPFEEIFFPQQSWPVNGQLHYMYYPWATPFNWLQYGPTEGNARLWRADELLAEWSPLAEHGVAGNSILIGNLLFVASDASMQGVVVYDIAPTFEDPPQPLQLLDKLSGAVGGYLAAVWENYLVLSGGSDMDRTFIIDYTDPTNLRLVKTFDFSGDDALNAGTAVPYVQTQDEFMFTRRHKVNMETLEIVLEFDEVGNNRPGNSIGGVLDVSQYTLPIGNLMLSGGIGIAGKDGVGVWCHDSQPDTRAPYVGYHIPRDGQTNYPLGAPITLIIDETLESFTIINGVTVSVAPVGGAPVDAWTSFAYDGILTITPREYLEPNQTYQVTVAANGIKDVSGNGIEPYSFTFSTGSGISGGNAAPVINGFTADAGPVEPGTPVTFNVNSTDADGDPLQYRFTFGDGTPVSDWGGANNVLHSFTEAGHYEVKVQVRDTKPDGSHSVASSIRTMNVAPVLNGARPTQSSTIALNNSTRQVWVVNPDNDSVTRFNADTEQRLGEVNLRSLLNIDTAVHPSSIAVDNNNQVWITARDHDAVIVLNSSGGLVETLPMGYGSRPTAVATNPSGNEVYISLWARGDNDRLNGQLVKFNASSRNESGRVELGPTASAIAISADGQTGYVSRFMSLEHFGEVWEVDLNSMNLNRSIPLWRDRGLGGLDSGGADGPGVPNYIASLTLHPEGDWLWYTALKMDTNRGLFFRQDEDFNVAMGHDTTVRSILGRIQLDHPFGPNEPGIDNVDTARPRVDIDNGASPSALIFSPRGDYLFTTLQGNNAVAVFDDIAVRNGVGKTSLWRLNSGSAPSGMIFDESTQNLWVKNFLSRSVGVYPMTEFFHSGMRESDVNTLSSVNSERLDQEVLAGKRIFYFAGDDTTGQNAMSFEGYLSCASCHIDGSHDGRTWDFTQRGEGFRNTTSLRGRGGTEHGNMHWTGNFDEVADFVLDIVNEFGGTGFLAPGQQPNPPLGAPNSGRSAALDQLTRYVESLGAESLPKSPYRDFDGQVDVQFSEGEALFTQEGCASCHRPDRGFTDSTLGSSTLHNVGTIRDSSGTRLNQTLSGFDTPTLLGSWNTAPYLHDGSAETLAEVFSSFGGAMHQAEDGQLRNGAQTPGFPQFNEDSSFHGQMVNLPNNGSAVRFNNVDGGSGGSADIELRILPRSDTTFSLLVNGNVVASRSVSRQLTQFEWIRVRFSDIQLLAGSNNQIEVRVDNTQFGAAIDDITIANSDVINQGQAHRRVQNLSAAQQTALLNFVRQLDGRLTGSASEDIIFQDSFEQ